MPTLEFKGKPFVHAHHLSVPFRELVIDADKSLPGADGPSLDDNLIIHGDNLEGLKALLPKYAGKVDCIFIDPPYNTGSEKWRYNDNVNSPLMQQWLASTLGGATVDKDDLERHDKWACMMWPRVALLRELLSESGSLWMTLDDNEAYHGRQILDEIFGAENFLANFVWQSKDTPGNNSAGIAETHTHLIFYRKSSAFQGALLERTEEQISNYTNPDGDDRGPWLAAPLTRAEHRDRDYYPITNLAGREVYPPKGSSWRRPPNKMRFLEEDKRIWWGKTGDGEFPMEKKFLSEAKAGVVNQTWWPYEFAGSTRNAGAELKALFEGDKPFDTPKPTKLLTKILDLATDESSIVLDSFAGSGTTAHAVLAANANDSGDRKFILIETEDYADTLTAERVRRVANGYKFKGSQKTELLRENLTWTKLKNADALLAKVATFDNLDGHRFNRIEKTVKDGELIVTGVIDCEETAPGLGGSFTYCELGEPMDMARFFDGATPPAFEQVARYVAYTATGATLDVVADGADHFIGEAGGYRLHLIYRADADFMRSDEAMLDMATAERIAAAGAGSGKPILVFAAGKYMGQKQLTAMGLTFAQLPYAIHRMLPGDGDGE